MMKQFDIFDLTLPLFHFQKDQPIRLVELFSGIGCQAMGMELLEIPYEIVATCEIDKFAVNSHKAIHGKTYNLGNIMDAKGKDFPKEIDIMTYSFPCTDLSKAGQRKGLEGTRSGLVYEVLRILWELKELNNLPKVLIMENVVDLVQVKFINEFQKIQYEIETLGYSNYTETLNSKEYFVPQNRDRVFMVSLLGKWNYNFPKSFELKYKLKDFLEPKVDESYYLSDKMFTYLSSDHEKHKRSHKFEKNQKPIDYEGVSNTITTRETNVVDSTFIKVPEATKKGYKEAYDGDGIYLNRPHQKRGVVQDGMIQTIKTKWDDVGVVLNEPIAVAQRGRYNENGELKQQFEVNDNGMSNALTTAQKDMMVLEPKNAKQELTNKMLATGNYEPYDMVRHSYTKERMSNLERKENENNISATLTTRPDTLGVVVGELRRDEGLRTFKDNLVGTLRTIDSGGDKVVLENNLRIRKLTPVETGRLMGMNDYQIARQRAVMSNAQMYKQHGNGIVVQVIGAIIGMLYYENELELREKLIKNSFDWLKGNSI